MPSAAAGVESSDPTATLRRVGLALIASGTGWIGLAVAFRSSSVDPSQLFEWSSVLSLYPGSAAGLFDADIVGVVTVAVGLSLVGLAALGDSQGISTTDRALRFRTALAVAAVGFVAAVASLPLGPQPRGPIAGPPVIEWFVEVRFLLAYFSVWLFPLGAADGRRERAIAAAGIAVVPAAAIGFTLAVISAQAGFAVLVGFFAVGASLALLAVTAVYGAPLYLAGRILAGHGAPGRLPTSWFRSG